MVHYDGALWLCWPALIPEYLDCVEDLIPMDAVYMLMRRYVLQWVAMTSVNDSYGTRRRRDEVMCSQSEEVRV